MHSPLSKPRFAVLLLSGLAALSVVLPVMAVDTPTYLDPNQPIEARIEDLLPRLTLEEKISLIHANSKFATAGVPRLGIPRCWMSDGPHGVREEISADSWKPAGRTDDAATAMPASICLAATWNPDLGFSEGVALGEEARARGKDILLGPGVNIMRTPLCGRNFEYLGEDPFLAGRMAVGYIKGQQSQDIASDVKHYALNNQEFQRGTINVEVDERALYEIYLPAFKVAVQEGGAWTVMGAYNKFRGQHCCHNDYLINKILKEEWGFKGLVMTDWGGAHDTRESALNGLDLEMGTDPKASTEAAAGTEGATTVQTGYDNYYLAQPYLTALKAGTLPMSGLDDKVRRNLRVMFAIRALDPSRKAGSFNTPEHQAVARQVAEEGAVLLKNQNQILPLDETKIQTIAVIGENATALQAHGGNSSGIKALYEIAPLEGITKRVGQKVKVVFSTGYQTRKGTKDFMADALTAARAADVVIYVGGLNHRKGWDCEGGDRKSLKLPEGQDELIGKIVAANPKTIVVLQGTPVEMSPWLDQVPAVLQTWYGGMENGNALARILFGDVSPSGKLPCTIPKRLEDSPAHALNAYPGVNGTVTYSEGLLVGYRWFDTKRIEPQFPFGFGLSYTTFELTNLKLVESTNTASGALVTVQVNVKNTGSRDGAEVVQVYVRQEKPSLLRPEKELKGFAKVFLKAGETKSVSIPLDKTAFAFYNAEQKHWVAEQGKFEILAGTSSRDLPLKSDYQLPQAITFK